MKKAYLIVFYLCSILLMNCGSDEGEQTIEIEERYALTIPSFLSETDNLNVDASLQYQNLFKEFYVAVIDEPKNGLQQILEDYNLTEKYDDNIDGYSQLIFDSLNESLGDAKQTEIVETTVNGMPARFTTFDGYIDDIKIFYSYGIYEGQDTYYQVIIWTLSDRQSKYKPKMDEILKTLKELQYRKKEMGSKAKQ